MCDPSGYSVESQLASIDVEQGGKTYQHCIINATTLIGANFEITGHNLTIVNGLPCKRYRDTWTA
jgi:hypothetical protein